VTPEEAIQLRKEAAKAERYVLGFYELDSDEETPDEAWQEESMRAWCYNSDSKNPSAKRAMQTVDRDSRGKARDTRAKKGVCSGKGSKGRQTEKGSKGRHEKKKTSGNKCTKVLLVTCDDNDRPEVRSSKDRHVEQASGNRHTKVLPVTWDYNDPPEVRGQGVHTRWKKEDVSSKYTNVGLSEKASGHRRTRCSTVVTCDEDDPPEVRGRVHKRRGEEDTVREGELEVSGPPGVAEAVLAGITDALTYVVDAFSCTPTKEVKQTTMSQPEIGRGSANGSKGSQFWNTEWKKGKLTRLSLALNCGKMTEEEEEFAQLVPERSPAEFGRVRTQLVDYTTYYIIATFLEEKAIQLYQEPQHCETLRKSIVGVIAEMIRRSEYNLVIQLSHRGWGLEGSNRNDRMTFTLLMGSVIQRVVKEVQEGKQEESTQERINTRR
jgi:hypothetical protein